MSLVYWAAVAQDQEPVEQVPTDKSAPPPERQPQKSAAASDNVPAGESSSKQTQIDVSPPADDTKKHPEADLGDSGSDVDEFTPYNPMKAMKDVEVGDFYCQVSRIIGAAISRYREALEYKPHDAEATFKLAEVLNKTGDTAEAVENYEELFEDPAQWTLRQESSRSVAEAEGEVRYAVGAQG